MPEKMPSTIQLIVVLAFPRWMLRGNERLHDGAVSSYSKPRRLVVTGIVVVKKYCFHNLPGVNFFGHDPL